MHQPDCANTVQLKGDPTLMKKLLAGVAMAALLAVSAPAKAAPILTFGQLGGTNTITATENGSNTQTTLTGTNIPVSITQIFGGVPTTSPSFLTLNATSSGVANSIGSVF